MIAIILFTTVVLRQKRVSVLFQAEAGTKYQCTERVRNTVNEASANAIILDWCAVLCNLVNQRYSRAAMRSVLILASHPDPASRLNSKTRKNSLFVMLLNEDGT